MFLSQSMFQADMSYHTLLPCTSLARWAIILELSDTTACAGEFATRDNASGILLLAGSPRAFGDRRCYHGVAVLATMFYLRAKKVAVSTRGHAGTPDDHLRTWKATHLVVVGTKTSSRSATARYAGTLVALRLVSIYF